jgi:hypothetical protein
MYRSRCAPLPAARLIERRHRLAGLPRKRLDLQAQLAPVAASGRAFAAIALGLWPLTAVLVLAVALVAAAGT